MKTIPDKTYKTAIMLFLAGLTFLTSLIINLKITSSFHASNAERDSRILAIRYLTHLGRSLWNTAGQKHLIVSDQELAALAMQAEAYRGMSRSPEAALYRLTEDRLGKLRTQLRGQDEIARPPYFNATSGTFDFSRYYLGRVFIPAAELLERQEQKKREGAFWDGKSEMYTAGLAVMAVAVFLLMLSLVMSGKVRSSLAGAGLALVVLILGLVSVTAARTWTGVPEESVKLYARASGQLFRAGVLLTMGGDIEAADRFARSASDDIERILARDPDYRSAVALRARLHTHRGESLLFAGRGEEGKKELEKALSDFERISRTKSEDGYVYWSRGFAELLLGRPGEARGSFDKALSILPDQRFALGVLKALALLNEGRGAESDSVLEEAIGFTLRRPLATDPIHFRAIVKNLERLLELRPDGKLDAVVRRLKQASVAVSILKKSRPDEVEAEVVSLEFVEPVTDRQGEIVDVKPVGMFPPLTARAHFLVEFKGMKPGLSVVRKVYRRLPGQVFWVEQLRLGRAEHWEGPAEARLLGSVENPLPEAGEVLSSGDYRLEVYIGGNLLASKTFKVS